MKLAIAHYVGSFEALDRLLDYTAISDDPQNYQRCIARERTLEMEICRTVGVPFFLILDLPETRGIHMAGSGGQDTFRRHLLYDADRRPVDSLAGYEILLRTSVSHERSALEFIEAKGGRNIADWPSQALTSGWYKHVKPEYLKRKLAWFRMDQVFEQDLNGFKNEQGQFFCKTNYKVPGYAGLTNDLVDFFDYQMETMPLSTEVIISEPLELLTDSRGRLEYRCFVVRNCVSTISRNIDYFTDYAISPEIEAFATSFVEGHRDILPDCYVLDVAKSDRGTVVIELNGIVASGRYEKNDFRKLLHDLQAASP